jgi:DNA-binding CsgD family transcriptional regulator
MRASYRRVRRPLVGVAADAETWPMLELIGRDEELRAAIAFLDDTSDGLAILVLAGDAGIGKTTFWSEVVARARAAGFAILQSRPAALEAGLTLSVLADLLEAVPDHDLAALPEAQRRALDTALLRVAPATGAIEPRVLGAAVRTVLTRLASVQPLAIAIDDLQWIDPASAAILGYSLRRLGPARVRLVAARRAGEPLVLDPGDLAPATRIQSIALGPLSVATLHHVLKSRLGRSPSRSTLVRVAEASSGNPLFALEIAQLLDEVGVPPAGEPLPVPANVRDLVRRRIVRLPHPTREVLLAAASVRRAEVELIERALGRPIEEDLEAAASDGIAHIDSRRIIFGHPLFAAAIDASASPAERRDVHRRLASVTEVGDERARHRALATLGPDAQVAIELDEAARHAAARAAPAAAVDLVELALNLTPASALDARVNRSIDLAGYLKQAGEPVRSAAILEDLIGQAAAGPLRARARLNLAAIVHESGTPARAVGLCEAAIVDAAGDQEHLARAHATLAAVDVEDFDRGTEHAEAAYAILEALARPDPGVLGLTLLVRQGLALEHGLGLDGAVVARALELEAVAPAASVSDRFSSALGAWLKYDDDLTGARIWLERSLQAAIDEGDEGSIPYLLSHMPQLELWAGDWPKAEQLARRHHDLSVELGLESQRRQALFNLAMIHVHQGRADEARREIEAGRAAAASDDDQWIEMSMLPALGLLELSLGNAGAATAALERATELRDLSRSTGPRRHEPDLVEALVAVGELDRAEVVLGQLEARAMQFKRHSALAGGARARGLLEAARGNSEGAVELLDRAITEHGLAPIPFERARTLLALGQIRRRRRERILAKVALTGAIEAFDRLGARLWAERARAELARVGLRRTSGNDLTETERRVAELAAGGMTNRAVAGALFVSPKTVEATLARAYRKLGVSSRAELGAVMSRGVRPET